MHQNQNLKHQYGDLALISTLWLTLPTSLFFLGQLSPSFGFDVWPTGELRNWVYFLQYDIFEAPHQFWLLDSRNALSPWWYNLASSSVIRRNPSCGPCFAAIDELVCWNIDVFITYKNNLFAAVWVDGWHPGSLLYPKPLLRRSYLEFCRSPWMQSAFNIFF